MCSSSCKHEKGWVCCCASMFYVSVPYCGFPVFILRCQLFVSAFLIRCSLNQWLGLFWCIVSFSFCLNRSTLSCPLSPQFCTSFYSVCPLFIFLFPTVVSCSGGEVVPTGWDSLPEGKAEPLRLTGRFRHCHHWQEAAAVAESDGAASGGELQVQKLTYGIAVENFYIIDIYII